MVGVAGKYKGCETCRRRRVTCHNERPACSNCVNSGRRCEGYEKQRVFITGTPENKGRVASHPKKATSSGTPSSSRSRSRHVASSTPEGTPERVTRSHAITPCKPLTSAWDDYIALESGGTERWALLTALQQPMQYVDMREAALEDVHGFRVGVAPYAPVEVSPSSASSIRTRGRCLVHLSSPNDNYAPTVSYCVWLYENDETSQTFDFEHPDGFDSVHSMGAKFFASFPHHHYFVRVFRPIMVGAAVMKRQHTFLADSEWISSPWENHPKSPFDQLLDLVAFLPYLIEKHDEIAPLEGTTSRRNEAQNLLENGLALVGRFEEWLFRASGGTRQQPMTYWAEEITDNDQLPFQHSYIFVDNVTGTMFLYYWMSQIPLHRCIESLYGIIYEPVLDVHPDMWSNLPSDLRIEDLPKFQQTRELAASVCRGLGFALDATMQPDLLVAPMTMALNLYKEINSTSQDCTLEILWLEVFQERLVEKGSYVASVVQEQTWVEVGRL